MSVTSYYYCSRNNKSIHFLTFSFFIQLRVVQEIDDELAHPTQKCDTTSIHCDKQSSQRKTSSSPSNSSSVTSRNCSRGTSFLSAMGLQTRSNNSNCDNSNCDNSNYNNNNHQHKDIKHLMAVRAKCVEELLNTEKDYVKMLKNIIEVCLWIC